MQVIKKIIPIFILLIISIGIIFYQFPNIPKNLSFDEVQFAKLALSLDNKPYAPYSPLASGHSTLYFYIILLLFKLFGITNFALRLPSALFGVLSVLVFYFLMKLVFKKPLHSPYSILYALFPFILSIIFITSRWYFNFARFSFEATFLIFLEMISLLFLLSYEQKKIKSLLVFSSIFAGLAYNSYTPGRIFVFIPLFTLFMIHLKDILKLKMKPLIFFIVPFLITILPLTFYISTHKDDRFDKQFFPKNTEMTIGEKVNFFTKNVTSITLMFDYKGDINGRHNYPGKPALNPILGILFFAGLILAIKNIKKLSPSTSLRASNQLFVLYLLIALIPATLTYPWENPNMLRTVTVIPSIVYFIGTVFVSMMNRFKNKKTIVMIVIILLIIVSSIYELRTYFVYQTQVFKDAFEIPMKLSDALKIIK